MKQLIFTDESGTHGNALYTLFAGYRAAPDEWDAFNNAWNEVLTQHEVTGAFHSREFWNRTHWTDKRPNQFVGWKDDRASSLITSLVAVIRQHDVHAVGAAVNNKDFSRLSYGDRCLLVAYVPVHLLPTELNRVTTKRPEPYIYAMMFALGAAMSEVHPRTRNHFYIAQHPEHTPRAVEAFWAIKNAETPEIARRMSDITPVAPAAWPGIQAADLLSFVWYRVEQMGGLDKVTDLDFKVFRGIRMKRSALMVIDYPDMLRTLSRHDPETRELFSTLEVPPGR